jgi:hypothetical protein
MITKGADMLEVVILINEREVARAGAFNKSGRNKSGLPDWSDYDVEGHDLGSAKMGFSNFQFKGEVQEHYRRQSPWALVEKIARLARPVDGWK